MPAVRYKKEMTQDSPESATEPYHGPERRHRAPTPEKQLKYDAAGVIRRALRERKSLRDLTLRETGDKKERLMEEVRKLIKSAMFRTADRLGTVNDKAAE